MADFYDFSGGWVQRDDPRLLKPGDLASAIGGEMRPGSNSVFTTGVRKLAGAFGSAEHVPGLLFAQHDDPTKSRLVTGSGANLYEALPLTASLMTGALVTLDGGTLTFASTPPALVAKQTSEKLFVCSGVGVIVTVDGVTYSPRRQNLIRNADGTWRLMSMIPPTDPPEWLATAPTPVVPAASLNTNSGWSNYAKAYDSNDKTRASAKASAAHTTRTVIYQFAAFTAANHQLAVLHSTGGGGSSSAPSGVVGAGGSTADPGTSSMLIEYSLDSAGTWKTLSSKNVPYEEVWSSVSIPDGSYGANAVQVRVTLSYVKGTKDTAGFLNTVLCTNAPATTQTAPLGFRYVVTEWDSVNFRESAPSAESDPVTMIANESIVTVKLPPGLATPAGRQNSTTTHWRIYRQPEGAASGEWDKYGQVAEVPVFTSPSLAVTGASNAGPIQITTSTAHGFSNGDTVAISGVLVNTAANGVWIIGSVSTYTFTLVGSTGNGAGTTGTARRMATAWVDRFDAPLTEVSRPTLRILVTGQGDTVAYTSKDAPHSLYKSLDIFKESVVGVPVDDPANVYFSPPGEYESRPDLYRIPARTVRNDSATGVKTLDDLLLIFFEGWTKRVQHLPLVINGLFDPSNAAEASTTRGAAGPLAFDDFTMSQDSGPRWVCAVDREGVYITNGYQFLPWSNNLDWPSIVHLGNDTANPPLPYLARTIVKNNIQKRRIEVYYVPTGGTAVTKRLDFFYGEGRSGTDVNYRPDGQPRVFGPHPVVSRGAVTAIVLGKRQRFTSSNGVANTGGVYWEDPDSYFLDDSLAYNAFGHVPRVLTTGDLPLLTLGQDGFLRSCALRVISGAYQSIVETVSMEFSTGAKRTVTHTFDPAAPSLFGIMSAGETAQYSLDDTGLLEKAVVLGVYVESRSWGKQAGGLRASTGAASGSTSIPT